MRNDLFLKSDVAKNLYDAVRDLPIVDYHCHLSPKEILEDREFPDIAQIWLGGDHYKWPFDACLRRAGGAHHQATRSRARSSARGRRASRLRWATRFMCGHTWSFRCFSALKTR